MENSIFRRSNLERISSPEQLNDYMRVSNPRIWTALIAVAILLISFIVWGVFGKLPTTLSLKGVANNGVVICYVPMDRAEDIEPGDLAMVDKKAYEVSDIAGIPLSKAEIDQEQDSDYVRSVLQLDEWNVKVTIGASDITDGIVDITITTDYTNPMSFLIN